VAVLRGVFEVEEFADTVAGYCDLDGRSTAELAKDIGVSEDTLFVLRRQMGPRRRYAETHMSLSTACLLARFFDLKLDDFIIKEDS
jgi:DNA-binding XRE family transcriptional regulator